MDKIRSLQEQLKTLYTQETQHRLTEASCVEIVLKLIEKGDLSLVFTLDGKEYLTHEQIDKEIKNEIINHGGRINIFDLQPILNVDISVIEDRVIKIVSKHANFYNQQGILMTNTYVDGVIEEVVAWVSERGSVNINDLVTRYQLPAPFLSTVIKRNMGTKINGVFDGQFLYTQSYLTKYKYHIRGIFNAIMKPTLLFDIRQKEDFKVDLFESTLNELIKNGELLGEIEGKGNRTTYFPHIYTESRNKWITNFVNVNGYIEYSMLNKLNIHSPTTFMEELSIDGKSLSSCYVSNAIIKDVNLSISEFIKKGKGYLHIPSLFTIPLDVSDMIEIALKCPSLIDCTKKKDSKIQVEKEFIVTNGFISECLQKYQSHITENPSAAIVAIVENTPEEEEEEKPLEKSKNKKGAKKAPPPKKKQPTKSTQKTKEDIEKEIAKNLSGWFVPTKAKSTDTLNCEDLFNFIAREIRSSLEIFSSKLQTTAQKESSNIKANYKEKLKIFEPKLNALYLNLSLFENGIQSVKEAALKPALSSYLISTLCQDLFFHILENQIIVNDIPLPNTTQNASNPNPPPGEIDLKTIDTQAIISLLGDPNVKASLKQMADICAPDSKIGTVLKFIQLVEGLAPKLEVQLKKLDKKTEKQLLFQHKKESTSTLEKTTNPSTAFHLILACVHIKQSNTALYVPPQSPEILLTLVKPMVSPVVYQKLEAYKDRLEAFKSTNSKEDEELLSQSMKETLKFALEKMNLETYEEKE